MGEAIAERATRCARLALRAGAGRKRMRTGGVLRKPMWAFIFAHLVKERGAVVEYDAKAIAEIMGLVFRRGAKEEKGAGGVLVERRKRPKSLSGSKDREFTIVVDKTSIFVVSYATEETPGWPSPSNMPELYEGFGQASPSVPTATFIEQAVEHGLPRRVLRHLAEWIAGGDKAKASVLERGIVPKTTLGRRDGQLTPQESERTERVARLSVHAQRALGIADEAREFMIAPHPELDGRSPVEVARTDLGARRAERILNALEYGLAI